MQELENYGKPLPMRHGWLLCPACPRKQFILHLLPNTEARNLMIYCRRCKTELKINIHKGKCFECPE